MSGFQKGKTKNHTQEQRLKRLEKVSSKNYFDLKQFEKNQLELAKQFNSGIPSGTFLQRLKWLLFGTPFETKAIEITEKQITNE